MNVDIVPSYLDFTYNNIDFVLLKKSLILSFYGYISDLCIVII